MMDDKGSTLICLWGLLPLSQEDDAARAIFAGINIIKELKQIDTYCNIGISSGECFSGVVGTSGSRKEFSVLGDVVNLGARIMASNIYEKKKNEIRCDLNTRNLASNYFDFEYLDHKEMKGKSIAIPVYKPKNPKELFDKAPLYDLPSEAFLLPHSNPMSLEKNSNRSKKIQTVGFQSILKSLSKDINKYFSVR